MPVLFTKISECSTKKPFDIGRFTAPKKSASKKTVIGNNKKLSANNSKFLEKKSL